MVSRDASIANSIGYRYIESHTNDKCIDFRVWHEIAIGTGKYWLIQTIRRACGLDIFEPSGGDNEDHTVKRMESHQMNLPPTTKPDCIGLLLTALVIITTLASIVGVFLRNQSLW